MCGFDPLLKTQTNSVCEWYSGPIPSNDVIAPEFRPFMLCLGLLMTFGSVFVSLSSATDLADFRRFTDDAAPFVPEFDGYLPFSVKTRTIRADRFARNCVVHHLTPDVTPTLHCSDALYFSLCWPE